MDLEVKQVSNSFEFFDMLYLVRKNDFYLNEFDCGWDGYLHYVITEVYNNPRFICFILCKKGIPIGYTIIKGPDALNNQIEITDMYITKENQGNEYILLLVDAVFDICSKVGVKRLVWSSPKLPMEYWDRVCSSIGINMKVKNAYSVDFDKNFSDKLTKDKVKKIHESVQ